MDGNIEKTESWGQEVYMNRCLVTESLLKNKLFKIKTAFYVLFAGENGTES